MHKSKNPNKKMFRMQGKSVPRRHSLATTILPKRGSLSRFVILVIISVIIIIAAIKVIIMFIIIISIIMYMIITTTTVSRRASFQEGLANLTANLRLAKRRASRC